jgi:TetR/AcrR family acrAB operon transcriptional repressor
MVRKTKEGAEITRQRIIKAARELFSQNGVSKTSLEKIAKHAGVTRGAVYWHFENKTALFHIMREQVFLPFIDRIDDTLLASTSEKSPLKRIENFLLATIHTLNEDQATRQTYEVLMIKCEYVDELADVLQQILINCSDIVEKIEQVYQDAHRQHLINPNHSPADLAMDTHLFFGGLLHMWVKDIEGKRFRNQAEALVKTHINLRQK